MLDPGAIADALHPAPDRDVADRVAHFSDAEKLGAALPSPRHRASAGWSVRDDASPFRFFGGVPSRNAFKRLVDGLRGGGERRVALQRDPDPLAGEIIDASSSPPGAPPSTIGSVRRGGNRFEFAAAS